jgi:hypothetical protein
MAAIAASLIPLAALAQEQHEQDFNIAAVGDWGCTENQMLPCRTSFPEIHS